MEVIISAIKSNSTKRVRVFLLLAATVILFSFKGVSPKELYDNFCKAIRSKQGMQYFAVIIVPDLNSGTTREICAPGNIIRSALHKEWNYDYDLQSEALVDYKAMMNADRVFKFKNTDAIQLLGNNFYTEADLIQKEKEVNFAALSKNIKEWGTWRKEFKEDDKELILYAHALFNQGILTGESKDELGTLVYINTTLPAEKNK